MTETPYGRVDRALHRIAFGALGAQRRLAAIETRMFRDRIDPAHARRPVFVTSLPRAGTTVLLEALAALPEFAAATYRHMPFTLLPLLWTDASRRFQQAARPAERAHGDGLAVGFDSPEAFEETLWMAFWPTHYRGGAIRPWTADAQGRRVRELLPSAHGQGGGRRRRRRPGATCRRTTPTSRACR